MHSYRHRKKPSTSVADNDMQYLPPWRGRTIKEHLHLTNSMGIIHRMHVLDTQTATLYACTYHPITAVSIVYKDKKVFDLHACNKFYHIYVEMK